MCLRRNTPRWVEAGESARWRVSTSKYYIPGPAEAARAHAKVRDAPQKMLTQQLRQLEGDGIVTRIVHAEVLPKVEYHLTEWGQSLCPALDRLLTWAEHQPSANDGERPRSGRS